jgi:hypothetical protein
MSATNQIRSLIAHVADHAVHLESLERRSRLALARHHLFGALL